MSCDYKLSKNFRKSEFEVSASYPELVEEVPETLQPNLAALVVKTLQPMRSVFGRMEVLSGYRSAALNSAVGGSERSQHKVAEAADIAFRDIGANDVFSRMKARWSSYVAGQVIYYKDDNFLHIASPSRKYPTPTFFIVERGAMRKVFD